MSVRHSGTDPAKRRSGRRQPSLFARLLVVIATVFGVGAGILGGAAWIYARVAADEAYDRLLVGAAFQIVDSISVPEGRRAAIDIPVAAFETLSLAPQDRVFYRVIGPSGATLTGDDDLRVPSKATPERLASGPLVLDDRYKQTPVRVVAVGRYLSDADVPGWAITLVAQSREARSALARDLTGKALILVLGMSALGILSVAVAIRLALAPLSRIEAALLKRDPHDLQALDVETPREVEALITSINGFMERLAGRIRVMHRFIADATHQIRTPLTALASQVDLLRDEPHEERRARQIERLQERTSELGRLTNQVLSHAMVIHRSEAVMFERVDLVAVARRALAEGVPLSLERSLDVDFNAPAEPVWILGDPVSLREAITNLVNNAVQHGAPTRLVVTVGGDETRRWVEVADDGPGIPPPDWLTVRKPFERLTQSSKTIGSGLGLAIVDDVAKAHDGAVSFRQGETDAAGSTGLFTVTLSFPASAQPTSVANAGVVTAMSSQP